jgi:NADPH2:quinone reductase
MKAVRIHATGGPEVLKYEDVEKPTAGLGLVVVKNEASGVNFIDIYHRSGLYKLALPLILGREGAGIVESVGEGVTDVKVGDKVAYHLTPGAYADYTAVPASKLYKLPDNVSTKEGAALMLQGLTAHYLLRSTFPVNASHTILVHAGAGGLGQLVIQIAKHLGAKVITTVSSDQKAAVVRSLGADHVIIYTTQDFLTEVRRITNNQGVDVVYDSVGLDTYKGSMDSLKPLGYLVLCGNSSGAVPPIDPLLLSEKGSLFVTRPTLANYTATREAFTERCRELFDWASQKIIKVSEPTAFPLSKAADAHEFLTSRKSTGKILLIPTSI